MCMAISRASSCWFGYNSGETSDITLSNLFISPDFRKDNVPSCLRLGQLFWTGRNGLNFDATQFELQDAKC
jgi:hypothetical protein